MRDSRQSKGVPASPSGHSRAEPEEVSVVPTSVPNAVPCAEKHEKRLAELAKLERGWNGYRAEPISEYCLDRARPLINLAEELGLQPWITPDTDRGLMLERAGEDDWSLEIHPNGSFDFCAHISCTWRAAPNADETAKLFLKFAATHFRSSLSASAGEAGTATTVQQGVVHEHAVPKADAQPKSVSPLSNEENGSCR